MWSDSNYNDSEKEHLRGDMDSYPDWAVEGVERNIPSAYTGSRLGGGRSGRYHQPTQDPDKNQLNTLAETTVGEALSIDKAKKKYPVVIPCVKGVSEQIKRVMKEYGTLGLETLLPRS